MARAKKLYINLSAEEYALLEAGAALSGEWLGSWARDVLVSRALGLHLQREKVMTQ